MYSCCHCILILKIDDCITKEYRMKKLADEQAESSKKHSGRKSSVTGKKKVDNVSEVLANLKPFMDRVMNDMKEILRNCFVCWSYAHR